MRRFEAIFSGRQNASMCDRKGMMCDSGIGSWNHEWSSLRMWHSGYADPRGMLDVTLLRYEEERTYMRHFFALVRQFDESARFDALEP